TFSSRTTRLMRCRACRAHEAHETRGTRGERFLVGRFVFKSRSETCGSVPARRPQAARRRSAVTGKLSRKLSLALLLVLLLKLSFPKAILGQGQRNEHEEE